MGIHQKRNERRTGEREQTLGPLASPRLLVFFFAFTSDARSVERTFAFIIYLKIGIHWRTNSENASAYTHSENREVWRKKLPRNDDRTARESTGIEVRLLHRGKNVALSTSGSRNQVVARNLLVLSCRDFEEMYIPSLKEDLLKLSGTDETKITGLF